MPKCWICDAEATSSEHRAKASDLKQVFGDISSGSPVHTTNTYGKPVTVRSVKSQRLTYRTRLCSRCNNTRTQPHDQAWQHLSALTDHIHKSGNWIDHLEVRNICSDPKTFLINVQLYFTKLFGCHVLDSSAPIPLDEFSDSIVEQRQNKQLFISFSETEPFDKPHIHLSEIKVVTRAGVADRAVCIYALNSLLVTMMYSRGGGFPAGAKEAWKPSSVKKRLRFKYEPLESERNSRLRSR